MKRLKSKIQYILLPSLFSILLLTACIKSYDDYNTIIKVILPFDCENCASQLLLSKDLHVLITSPANGKAGDEIPLTIDWESATWINPKSDNLSLGFKVYKRSGSGLSEFSWYEFVYKDPLDLKPGKKYVWDAKKETITEDGNTAKKVRESADEVSEENATVDCMSVPSAKAYFDKISNPNGPGCQPCANCAALACAKHKGDPELIELYTSAVKKDEAYYEKATCPELY